jgi:hypothetical protein
MAAADRIVGSDVVVHFLPTGGTPGTDEIVLTADFTSFDWNRQVDVVDVTAGNEQDRYKKVLGQGFQRWLSIASLRVLTKRIRLTVRWKLKFLASVVARWFPKSVQRSNKGDIKTWLSHYCQLPGTRKVAAPSLV